MIDAAGAVSAIGVDRQDTGDGVKRILPQYRANWIAATPIRSGIKATPMMR